MLRVIRVKKPKYFVAENVEGILTLGKGAVIQKILKDFTKNLENNEIYKKKSWHQT